MWPPSWQCIEWTLTVITILMLFFSTFGQTRWCFLFEVYMGDPNMDHENSAPWGIHYPYFFQIIFWFFCYFSLETPKFPSLYIYPAQRKHPTILKPVFDIVTKSRHHPYFFPKISIFLLLFFKFASLYIYPAQRKCPTILKPVFDIVTKSKHHPYFFPEICVFLLLFFIWKSMHFLTWKCALDPENSAPPLSPTVTTIPVLSPIYSAILLIFLFGKAYISLFGSEPWTTQNIALGR